MFLSKKNTFIREEKAIPYIHVFCDIMWLSLGLSTGQSGSNLCPTRNQPAGIGWQKIEPVVDRWSNRIGQIRPSTGGGRVGQSHRSEKTVRKRWEKLRSGENLIEFYEISPNLVKFSPDLSKIYPRIWVFSLGSRKLWPKSRNFCRTLCFFGRFGFFDF